MDANKLSQRARRFQDVADRYMAFKLRRYVRDRDKLLSESRAQGKHLYRRDDQWFIA